jgi:hypothetical protein
VIAVSHRVAIGRSNRSHNRHDFAFDDREECGVLLKKSTEHLVHYTIL